MKGPIALLIVAFVGLLAANAWANETRRERELFTLEQQTLTLLWNECLTHGFATSTPHRHRSLASKNKAAQSSMRLCMTFAKQELEYVRQNGN